VFIGCFFVTTPFEEHNMPVNSTFAVFYHRGSSTIFSCGKNSCGQLGTGDKETRVSFTQVSLPVKLVSFAAGHSHCLGVSDIGDLWGWGENNRGQLGLSGNPVVAATKIPHSQGGFVSVSAGEYFSLAMDNINRVWAFGYNNQGRLGLGDTTDRNVPALITTLPPIQSIACCFNSGHALDVTGKVWSFGYSNGQFGPNGSYGSTYPAPVCSSLNNITKIAAGYGHLLALDSSGVIWSSGKNDNGQLGRNKTSSYEITPMALQDLPEIADLWCGAYSSYIRDKDGHTFVFGRDEGGKSAIRPTENPELFNLDLHPGGAHLLIVDNFGYLRLLGTIPDCTSTEKAGFVPTEKVLPISRRNLVSIRSQIEDGKLEEVDETLLRKLLEEDFHSTFFNGQISWCGWDSSWKIVLAKQNTLKSERVKQTEALEILEAEIDDLQKTLQEKTQLASNTKISLENLSRELDTHSLLEKFFKPLSEIECTLVPPFKNRIKHTNFSVDKMTLTEVLAFLNIGDLQELSAWFKELEIDGEAMLLLSDHDFRACNINLATKLKFFYQLSLLKQGIFLDPTHNQECPVCKFRSPQDLELFWAEWQCPELRKLGLDPYLFVGFDKSDLSATEVAPKERAKIWKDIEEIQATHKQYVNSMSKGNQWCTQL
jgi:alpha-tubulin suppressor-like RCC1 family protein